MAIYFDLALTLIQHYYSHQSKGKEIEIKALLPHYRAFYMHFQGFLETVCFHSKDLLTFGLSSKKMKDLKDNSSKLVKKSYEILH